MCLLNILGTHPTQTTGNGMTDHDWEAVCVITAMLVGIVTVLAIVFGWVLI